MKVVHRLAVAIIALGGLALTAVQGTALAQATPPTSDKGRYIIVPKAGGLDWTLLLDSQTGATWRLAFIPSDNTQPPKGAWKWTPIVICPDCQ